MDPGGSETGSNTSCGIDAFGRALLFIGARRNRCEAIPGQRLDAPPEWARRPSGQSPAHGRCAAHRTHHHLVSKTNANSADFGSVVASQGLARHFPSSELFVSRAIAATLL